MWKGAAVALLATLAIGWHFSCNQQSVEVPTLPNQYWGPGKSKLDDKDIKPFRIDIPKSVIDDLNKRIDSTRYSAEPLEGAAWTYGIPSTYLKTVLNYWRNKYNWTERQALLNKYPQFKTRIQGLDIHYYHIKPTVQKSQSARVIPLLLVHGWPGSFVEFQKIIPELTTQKPDRDFVFELIIPSLPGYGFSSPAARPGLGPAQIAVVFKNLMSRLGFNRFYTQGGDWGSFITTVMALLYPQNIIGAHVNMCMVDSMKAHFLTMIGTYLPYFVVDNEHYSKMYPLSHKYSRILEESGYMHIQATKPDTVGTALSDSPAGLAAYLLEKFSTWTNPDYRFRDDGGLTEKYTLDELLDNIMIYWVTNSITTSQRIYAENFSKSHRDLGLGGLPVSVPSACAAFPHELAYQSETIVRTRFTNLIQFTHQPRGGHFAAFEEPKLLAEDFFSFVQKNEKILADEKKAEEQKKTKKKNKQ